MGEEESGRDIPTYGEVVDSSHREYPLKLYMGVPNYPRGFEKS